MNKLYIVATPIGNLSDISKRALDTLKEVDLILCEDTRHSLKLLNYYNIKKRLMSYHKFNEQEQTKKIIEELKDKDIALITDAGTPCISDPGHVLINECINNSIEVIPVGGISAITTSLSISGFDIKSFSFYGFFPRETKDKKELIKEIKKSDIKIFVFYESPKRIIKTLSYLEKELEDLEVVLCSDLTKLHEKKYYGKIGKVLKELMENSSSELGEYTLIIYNKKKEEKETKVLSVEALLVDLIIKNNISLKEAIETLSKNEDINKKEIYNASLNLKKYFDYRS